MKRKIRPKRPAAPAPAILAPAAPPVVVAAVLPPREPLWQAVFTDRNREFDTGRVLVAVVILAMCGFQWYDISVGGTDFSAQNFGIGIASVLGGFAAYLYGDAQRPPLGPPSTVTTTQQTQVTTP